MTQPTTPNIPRTAYGLAMLGATLIAGSAAWLVALRLGAQPAPAGQVLGVVLAASIASFIPLVRAIPVTYWGLAVLGSGALRSLVILGASMVLREAAGAGRPAMMGALAGAVIILVIETIAAVKVLSGLGRARAQLRGTGQRPAPADRKLA